MSREQLVGGPKRELRNAGVVAAVLAEPARVGELFACVLDPDEYVRMRAADALEKVCRTDQAILEPFTERVFEEMAVIDQPSVQWHVAQILGQLPLDAPRRRRAVTLVRGYLDTSNDWIVLSYAMDTLARFAEHDPRLRLAIDPKLARLVGDPRPAVAKRAQRIRQRLGLPVTPPLSTTVATDRWRTALPVDPVPLLAGCGHPAIEAFARRHLLDDPSVDVAVLSELPEARRVLERQQRDGRWRYRNPKPEIRSVDDYDQLETYRRSKRPAGSSPPSRPPRATTAGSTRGDDAVAAVHPSGRRRVGHTLAHTRRATRGDAHHDEPDRARPDTTVVPSRHRRRAPGVRRASPPST